MVLNPAIIGLKTWLFHSWSVKFDLIDTNIFCAVIIIIINNNSV